MCAGKRKYVTRVKETKQKRYLSYTLRNLHKKYIAQYPDSKISYIFFCRHRPFWIKELKINDRDTCKCIKHTNMEFLICSLFKSKIIMQHSIDAVIKALCCVELKKYCLLRTCAKCGNSKIIYKQQNVTETGEYFRSTTEKNKYFDIKTQKEKVTTKITKNNNSF